MSKNKIPMFLNEQEIDDNLPTERTYSHSGLGAPVGYVIMPDGMFVERFTDYLALRFNCDDGKSSTHVASLSGGRVIQAAIAGEFGLKWKPKRKSPGETAS